MAATVPQANPRNGRWWPSLSQEQRSKPERILQCSSAPSAPIHHAASTFAIIRAVWRTRRPITPRSGRRPKSTPPGERKTRPAWRSGLGSAGRGSPRRADPNHPSIPSRRQFAPTARPGLSRFCRSIECFDFRNTPRTAPNQPSHLVSTTCGGQPRTKQAGDPLFRGAPLFRCLSFVCSGLFRFVSELPSSSTGPWT